MSAPPVTAGRTLDHVAAVYDWLSPLMTFGQERRIGRRALDLLPLSGNERVLDVGCGTGLLTLDLASRLCQGGQAVGLDAAPRMLAVARRKAAGLDNVQFDAAVAESLPYPTASFDHAVSAMFFHHINRELKRRAVSELHRVVKPGGHIVIVDVDMPCTPFGTVCAWSGYWLFRQSEIRENIRGELRTAIAEAGFAHWRHVRTNQGYIGVFELVR